MATIFDLPNELVVEVGAKFDEDDWLALRMTCQTLNDQLREFHLNSKYKRRKVFLVRQSIENLVKISQHPSGMNLRVQHLEISCQSPYALEGYRRFGYNHTLLKSPSLKKNEINIMLESDRVAEQYHTETDTNSEMHAINASLMKALSNLPNLEGFCFAAGERVAKLTRPEWNLFYPSLKLEPGMRFPEGLRMRKITDMRVSRVAVDQGWNSILRTICSMSKPKPSLRYLTWEHSTETFSINDASAFLGCTIKSVFPNLQILKVVLDFRTDTTGSWRARFPQWLSSIGAALEELEIDFNEDDNLDDELYQEIIPLPEVHLLSGLRKLNLHGFRLDAENFIVFLAHCKGSLRELTLCRLAMPNAKENCFKILKFLNSGFKLRLFKLKLQDYGCDSLVSEVIEYLLPDLEIVGDWSLHSTVCKVEGWDPKIGWSLKKHLERELDAHNSPDKFWDSISDGLWVDSEILKSFSYEDSDESNSNSIGPDDYDSDYKDWFLI